MGHGLPRLEGPAEIVSAGRALKLVKIEFIHSDGQQYRNTTSRLPGKRAV